MLELENCLTFEMRGMIWNSDGFRDPRKHVMVNENVQEYKLDFVAIVETGRSNFATHFLKFLAGGFEYEWFCLPLHGRSGGILVGMNMFLLYKKLWRGISV